MTAGGLHLQRIGCSQAQNPPHAQNQCMQIFFWPCSKGRPKSKSNLICCRPSLRRLQGALSWAIYYYFRTALATCSRSFCGNITGPPASRYQWPVCIRSPDRLLICESSPFEPVRSTSGTRSTEFEFCVPGKYIGSRPPRNSIIIAWYRTPFFDLQGN